MTANITVSYALGWPESWLLPLLLLLLRLLLLPLVLLRPPPGQAC